MIGQASTPEHPRLRQPQRRRRLRHGPHLGPEGRQRHRQQRRHAGRQCCPSTATVAGRRRGQRQDRERPARHRAVAGLRAPPATSTCSTSRRSTRTTRSTRAWPTATRAGSRRWRSARISRFTINLATKKLDLNSEVVIFEYDAQIYCCCHLGGGMGFDSEGNLYVTTGDTNSSQSTNGYSGNNQPQRCPTGDADAGDQHALRRRTTSRISDARRTAGNTNDYNGKMLRFNPIDSSPTGRSRRSASARRTRCRRASSPNGPNLFDGTEGGGGKTKPEIYAMGLRNPVAHDDRPEDGRPVRGVGRPGRRRAERPPQGPSTYETADAAARARATTAGRTAWATSRPTATASPTARCAPPTAPATSTAVRRPAPTDGWYDCNNLVNDSPNNTGLVDAAAHHGHGQGRRHGALQQRLVQPRQPGQRQRLPGVPAPSGRRQRARTTAPRRRQLCPYLTASGATVFNGPVYRYNATATDNSARWPEYWDGRWFLNDYGNTSPSTRCCWIPATDRSGAPAGLRGQLPRHAAVGRELHGLQVRSGRRALRPGLRRASSPPAPTPACTASTTWAAPTRRARTRSGSADGDRASGRSSRSAPPAASPTSGTSATAQTVDRAPTRRTPTPTAGTYTAKLTVTYADGEKASQDDRA